MKNVLFVAPTTYEIPLTENIEKKFKYLNEICNLHIFAFADKKTYQTSGNTKLYLYKKVKNRILNYIKIFFLSVFTLPTVVKKKQDRDNFISRSSFKLFLHPRSKNKEYKDKNNY